MNFLSSNQVSTSLASFLIGVWRTNPPNWEGSESKLELLSLLLLGSGAGALGWWKIRNTELSNSVIAQELKQAYRLHTLQAAVHQHKIAETFQLLRSANIEPILLKGFAAALMYPEMGLRPYGDIDLIIHPSQIQTAAEMIKELDYSIDLAHEDLEELDEFNFEKLYSSSKTVEIENTLVRILSTEDQLRFYCLHFLKHGGWRPLWLCDIAAAIELLPNDFDWDKCLTNSKKRMNWILCAISLAQKLLEAKIDAIPHTIENFKLPSWVLDTVLKQWKIPYASHQAPGKYRTSIKQCWSNPFKLSKALMTRWPDPLTATMSIGGSLNEFPRLPFQFASGIKRTTQFIKTLIK